MHIFHVGLVGSFGMSVLCKIAFNKYENINKYAKILLENVWKPHIVSVTPVLAMLWYHMYYINIYVYIWVYKLRFGDE